MAWQLQPVSTGWDWFATKSGWRLASTGLQQDWDCHGPVVTGCSPVFSKSQNIRDQSWSGFFQIRKKTGPDRTLKLYQNVSDHSWCLCEVTLTILQCLCILSKWVIIQVCVKAPWPFAMSVHPQAVSDHSWCFKVLSHPDHLGSGWSYLMLVWSHPDRFAMSVHPQQVSEHSWWLCESPWPSCNVCASSASEWWFLMLVWSHLDHFAMSVHPQYVSDHSWWLCEVTLTILQCLCILSMWVIILDACVKSLWPFCNVCAFSASEWSFLLMLVWSHPAPFAMSVHPQQVSDCSWCLCEVTLTILQFLCIPSEWVITLDACVKLPWPFCNVSSSSGSE